jgi:ribonuclease Z
MIDVCLLGNGGMMPLPGRPLSACLVRVGNSTILFDCGEGTQVGWRATGWSFRPAGTILLSHVHADHVAGLPGVLFQIAHSGREEPVTIYGPDPTLTIVQHLVAVVGRLPFELRVATLGGDETIDLGPGLTLSTIVLQHRATCLGYRLDLARAPRFEPDKARALGVPQEHWKRLQNGEIVDGVTPDQVTGPPRAGLRVALITDTAYVDELPSFVAGSDLLVCEAMYAADADEQRARDRGHMTARQAATVAARARVRRLWLTHFSPSVADPEDAARAAQPVFPPAVAGYLGLTETLRFEEE